MNSASSYIVHWVYTKEHGDITFPLVYLCNGNLSYSLLCFINSQYKNKKAKQTFEAYSPSSKKSFLRWVYSAKRSETKLKRITAIVEAASKRKKPW